MKTTLNEKKQKQLIRKLHALFAKARIDTVGKRDILHAYGVEHSNELDCDALIEICNKLEQLMAPKHDAADVLRKRVMGSIGGWLRMVKIEGNAALIKSIACRATGCKYFNAIPEERLRNVYNTFLNKQKDAARANDVTASLDNLLSAFIPN